ncbi:hypothetical protein EAG_14386, partial [Camponotus floridanus]
VHMCHRQHTHMYICTHRHQHRY